MSEVLFIPKLGNTVEEVTIIEWLVEDGAQVEEGQEVLEIETDKATYAVEATASGYLHRGPFKPGDVVPVLDVVAIIGEPDETWADSQKSVRSEPEPSAPELAAPAPAPVAASARVPTIQPVPDAVSPERVFASPRARKLAQRKGVDLALLSPTGPGGRIIERDVLAFLEQRPKASPLARKMAEEAGINIWDLQGSGPGGQITKRDVEQALRTPAAAPKPAAPPAQAPEPATLPEAEVLAREPLKGVRAIIAERMAASVHTTARVTLVTEADATDFVAMRNRLKAAVSDEWGFAPGYNDLLGLIVAKALRKFPYMNARLTADAIEHLAHINLGMAVDTERGLLVPVIKQADAKSLREFGTEFRELVDRARRGRSLPDDLSGGTFTITNLGMYDIDAFTPVINLPEAAILGVGRIAPKPDVKEGEVVVRQMWTLSLVFDHRLVDGAPAARFLQHIKNLIEEPYLLLVE